MIDRRAPAPARKAVKKAAGKVGIKARKVKRALPAVKKRPTAEPASRPTVRRDAAKKKDDKKAPASRPAKRK